MVKRYHLNEHWLNTPPWVIFTFFKLCKWYQIAQSISHNIAEFKTMIIEMYLTLFYTCKFIVYNSRNTESPKLIFGHFSWHLVGTNFLKFQKKKKKSIGFRLHPRSNSSKFLKSRNSCHRYFLILIFILSSINKNLKTCFYLEYISSFQIKKSFSCTEPGKLENCRKTSSHSKFDVIKKSTAAADPRHLKVEAAD